MRYKLQHSIIPYCIRATNNDLKEGTDLPVIFSNASHKKPIIPQTATSAGPIKLKDNQKKNPLDQPTATIGSHGCNTSFLLTWQRLSLAPTRHRSKYMKKTEGWLAQ
jgi:hypothetical protein